MRLRVLAACALLSTVDLSCAQQTHDADASSSPDGPSASACASVGDPPTRTCPDGCRALEGRLVDAAMDCVTTSLAVVACYAPSDDVIMNGEVGCFEWGTPPTTTVITPTTDLHIGSQNRILSEGFRRCSRPASEFPECSP